MTQSGDIPFDFQPGSGVDLPRVVAYLTDAFRDPIDALEQLLRNAFDATASRVIVRVGRDAATGSYMEVEDNGTGFLKETLQFYIRLGASPKDGLKTHGQHGIGAKAATRFAGGVNIITKRADDAATWQMVYTMEQWFAMLAGTENPADYVKRVEGKRSPLRTSGTIIRWSGIHTAVKKFGADRLRDGLADLLSPEEAARVFVEEVGAKSSSGPQPVVAPTYKGTPIRCSEYIEGFGQVTVDLTVLSHGASDNGAVRVWAFQRGPEWLHFVRAFRGDKRLVNILCIDTLGDAGVVGRIYFPCLSPYSSPDRKDFVGLDGGEGKKSVEALLHWLAVVIAPQIAQIQQRQRTTHGDTAHLTEIRSALAEMRANIGGEQSVRSERGPRTRDVGPRSSWYVSPTSVRLTRGGTAVLQVAVPPAGSTFRWNVGTMGSIRTIGPEATQAHFTAGNTLAQGTLVVSEIRAGAVVCTKNVTVEILARLPLATNPGTIALVFGEQCSISLVNTIGTTGVFSWAPSGGGELEVASDTRSAVFTAGQVLPGEFPIIITEKGGERQTFKVRIRVGPSQEGQPEEDVIVIRGRSFRVTASHMPERTWELARLVGDEEVTVVVNTGHPSFRAVRTSPVAFRAIFCQVFAMTALQALLEDTATADDLARELPKLLAELTTKSG